MVYIHNGISAIKSIETGTFIVMRLDPESVIQNEGSQKKKNKHLYTLMDTCGI